MGCEWIHVVDIDGAFSGYQVNQEIIYDIKNNTDCKIQVGGGIRDMKTIETYLSNSIDRVILGTIAAKKPSIIEESCRNFPNKIVVGIDSKNDLVATEGWSETSSISTIELAKRLEGLGVASIIFTVESTELIFASSLFKFETFFKILFPIDNNSKKYGSKSPKFCGKKVVNIRFRLF